MLFLFGSEHGFKISKTQHIDWNWTRHANIIYSIHCNVLFYFSDSSNFTISSYNWVLSKSLHSCWVSSSISCSCHSHFLVLSILIWMDAVKNGGRRLGYRQRGANMIADSNPVYIWLFICPRMSWNDLTSFSVFCFPFFTVSSIAANFGFTR